jgi:hypothetical protein
MIKNFLFASILISHFLFANEVITIDQDYVGSIKLYNTGIKEDPVSGGKVGKGVPALNSSYWIKDLGCFIAKNLLVLKDHMKYAYEASERIPGMDFVYFCNQANQFFCIAENQGLHNQEALDSFMMASWLIMAAAEVDDYDYNKYSKEERKKNREEFYNRYFKAENYSQSEFISVKEKERFFAPLARIDLIPFIALERLALHNELCGIKYKDPTIWKHEGFPLSSRISSLKRHFDCVHNKKSDEDHIAHLIWNFMAIYHVLNVHSELNDLTNYEALKNTGKL